MENEIINSQLKSPENNPQATHGTTPATTPTIEQKLQANSQKKKKKTTYLFVILGIILVIIILIFFLRPILLIRAVSGVSDFYYSKILQKKTINERVIDNINIETESSSVQQETGDGEVAIQPKLTSGEEEKLRNTPSLTTPGCILNSYNSYKEAWIQECGKIKEVYKECLLPVETAEQLNKEYRESKTSCFK